MSPQEVLHVIMGKVSQQSLHLYITDPPSAPTGQAGLLLLAFVFLWRLPGWAGVLTVQLGGGRSVPRDLPTSGTHSDGGIPGQDSPWAECLQ